MRRKRHDTGETEVGTPAVEGSEDNAVGSAAASAASAAPERILHDARQASAAIAGAAEQRDAGQAPGSEFESDAEPGAATPAAHGPALSPAAAASARGMIGRFLGQERDFLNGLAALIQNH